MHIAKKAFRSAFAACALLIAACSSVKSVTTQDFGTDSMSGSSGGYSPDAKTHAPVIYVADFDLDAADIESGGLLHRLRPPSANDSAARHLINLMAEDIVSDLAQRGFEAWRLRPGVPPPKTGWRILGAFLQVDEGNRLRRALVGFGAGHTDLQVDAGIDDLSAAASPVPIRETQTSAASGKAPGAAVTLNPYAAAIKFVVAKGDLDKNVKDTAAKIADAVAARWRATS